MNVIKQTCAIVLGMSAVILSGHALAAPLTVAGATVSFTFDSDLAGLFGAPTVLGDTISFTPTTFMARSLNGTGFAYSSQTFNIAVSANPGYLLSVVNLAEGGDYFNIGSGASVAVGGKLNVRDLGTPLAPPAGGSILASQPLTAVTSMAGFETTNWTATARVAIPAGWGGADGIASGVNLTIQNLLLTKSPTAGSAAFIENTFAGIDVITTPIVNRFSAINVAMLPVPEPQAYALFLAGLSLVGYMARRRSVASA
jgi:hypothetical protein